MAQDVKTYAAEPGNLNLNSGTHIEKENNSYSCPVPPHKSYDMETHINTYICSFKNFEDG